MGTCSHIQWQYGCCCLECAMLFLTWLCENNGDQLIGYAMDVRSQRFGYLGVSHDAEHVANHGLSCMCFRNQTMTPLMLQLADSIFLTRFEACPACSLLKEGKDGKGNSDAVGRSLPVPFMFGNPVDDVLLCFAFPNLHD